MRTALAWVLLAAGCAVIITAIAMFLSGCAVRHPQKIAVKCSVVVENGVGVNYDYGHVHCGANSVHAVFVFDF
jgi:hypothetical protein